MTPSAPKPPRFQGPNSPGPSDQRDWASLQLFLVRLSSLGLAISGLHAHRATLGAASFNQYFFYETDTTLLYASTGAAWAWVGGSYARTQAQVAAFAAGLGASDAGTRVYVSDYAHVLMWTGAAFVYAPEDDQMAGAQVLFLAPPAAGWHLCDGSHVSYLLPTGALSAPVALPTIANTFFRI